MNQTGGHKILHPYKHLLILATLNLIICGRMTNFDDTSLKKIPKQSHYFVLSFASLCLEYQLLDFFQRKHFIHQKTFVALENSSGRHLEIRGFPFNTTPPAIFERRHTKITCVDLPNFRILCNNRSFTF